MAPTLRDGQRVLARRLHGHDLNRGDIVVFWWSAQARRRTVSPSAPDLRIKRVAAVGGDATPPWLRPTRPDGERVPDGHLVVAGDNRRSQDSRQLGYIGLEQVLAVVDEVASPP